jgi:hypothetical protein
MKGIALTIVPKGAVTGRIVDRNGMPVVRAAVQALKYMYLGPQQGRSLTAVQSVTTEDNGTYRLFWLSPGNYVIGASTNSATRISVSVRETVLSVSPLTGPIQGAAVRTPRNDGSYEEEIPVPSYYPGTTSAGEATTVGVRAGETVSGIDFAASSASSHRIRGVILDRDTQRPVATAAQLIPKKTTGNSPLTFRSSETGNFEISGVVAGEYLLNGVPIIVGNTDLENLVLNTSSEAVSIEGKVKYEVAASGESARNPVRIGFTGITYSTVTTTALVQADGSFKIDLMRGDYFISLLELSSDIARYLKSARFGNQDGLDGLHIQGKAESPMEIVVGSSKGSVDARILDSRHETVRNATVVLAPDPPRRHRTDMYLTATADSAGKFHFNAMPGDYKIFAWEDVETGVWLDPEFMAKYEGRGQPVTVREGSQDAVDVSVIPYVP